VDVVTDAQATSAPKPTTEQNAKATLLAIDKLEIDFAQPRPAVDGISLEVAAREVVALVGESGSGKSMTARATLGLLPPGATARGSIRVNGREVLGASEADLNRVRGEEVGLVFQEPQSALNPVRTVGWQIREALRAHRSVSRRDARARGIELLEQVEIPDAAARIDYYPHQLSGGQRQRAALALALANEPALLLADEPTTALDVTVQAEILALLGRLRDEIGMGVLLITHNMGIVAQMADRVIVLKTGEVVETGETRALFANPRHPYTKQLLATVPRLPEPDGTVAVIDPAAEEAPRATEDAAVSFERASVVFPARHGSAAFTAVDDVSFVVRPGEVLALVGESGSGKTTLGRVAAGLVPVATGRALVEGQDLAEMSARQLREMRRDLAFVHQDPAASLDPRLTVAASIREPLDVHAVGDRSSREARVTELLEAVHLPSDFATRRPHALSGGQRQRVALARALALRPRLVIADEPTSALDVSVQAAVLELFGELQAELGFACIFISHDLAVVHDIADRVVVLRSGRIVEAGPIEQVFANPKDPYTRTLLEAVPIADPSRRGERTVVGGSPARSSDSTQIESSNGRISPR
jgi:peptide/nickel transport system ATP-binding protein